MALTRIISGGQTGVDRGALDAALAAGFSCGGWCPPDRQAEDGRIPGHYPLTKLEQGGYRQRTIRNIVDSDGTLLIYFGEPEGGTEQTLLHCINKGRPYKLIDAEELTAARASELLADFIARHEIAILNVAGPRLSKAPNSEAYTFEVIKRYLSGL